MIPRDPDLPRPLIVLHGGVVYEDFGRGLEPIRHLTPGRENLAVIRSHNSRPKLSPSDVIAARARLAHRRANLALFVVTCLYIAGIICGIVEVYR